MAYGFYFDSTRCTGCRTCEMACKDYKDIPAEIAFRRVFDYEGGSCALGADGTVASDAFMYHVSDACNHCENPKCFAACPTGAIEKDDDGIVFINQETCTGNGACVDACPYGVPILVKEEGKAKKCDMCRDRVAEGKQPICVEACPLRALEWGDLDELKAAHPDAVAGIAPLADPSETGPSLLINACPAAKEPGDTTGFVANEKEVTGVAAFE